MRTIETTIEFESQIILGLPYATDANNLYAIGQILVEPKGNTARRLNMYKNSLLGLTVHGSAGVPHIEVYGMQQDKQVYGLTKGIAQPVKMPKEVDINHPIHCLDTIARNFRFVVEETFAPVRKLLKAHDTNSIDSIPFNSGFYVFRDGQWNRDDDYYLQKRNERLLPDLVDFVVDNSPMQVWKSSPIKTHINIPARYMSASSVGKRGEKTGGGKRSTAGKGTRSQSGTVQ